MKKSSASNTFTDGMVMDFNTIVTPDNVLTNCLNGTLTTFNGNENVLQNDMGNVKVETAFLPKGYVPLGTAELGGIIYVVSYNPLLDKCQIGSFPSPERNITKDEISENKVIVKNDQFQELTYKNGVITDAVVKNAIVKVKLFEGLSKDSAIDKLNPGDKYSVYTKNNGIINNQYTISDVNTNSSKIDESPKFITIHIVSIGDDGKITYLDDSLKWDSELHYYIKDSKPEEVNTNLTNSAYNIFNSKVSGELALLFELKTIDTMSISWDAEVTDRIPDNENTDDKTVAIKFKANWTSDSDEIVPYGFSCHYDFDKGETKNTEIIDESQDDKEYCFFDFGLIKVGSNGEIIVKKPSVKESNQYKICELTYNSKDLSKNILTYNVIPDMKFGKLKYLETEGVINFSEIGSGKIYIDEWRYYIQDSNFYLNWGLSAYPEKNKSIKNIVFEFIRFDKITKTNIDKYNFDNQDQNPNPYFIINDKSSYSGNFQELIDFGKSSKIKCGEIEKNTLYLVNICIKYNSKEDTDHPENDYRHEYRWIYTTGQWNKEFSNGKKDFKELTLDSVVDITSDCKITDNISEDIYTKYPELILNEKPEDDGRFSSMGVKTIVVNYDKSNNIFKDDSNININLSLRPDKYTELFEIDNSSEITYTNKLVNKEIKHSNFVISSDKKSSVSESVMSETMELDGNFPSEFNETVNSAINNQITSDSKFTDTFDANIINGENSNNIDVNFKGAIFSRINSDIVQKTITAGQLVAPLLYTEEDLSDLGLTYENGEIKLTYYFKEGHRDGGGSKPIYFKLGYCNFSNGGEITSRESTKDEWDPEDDPVRDTYWDDMYPFTEWLIPWMQNTKGPFKLLEYGGYNANDKNRVIKKDTNKDITGQFGLWVRTNNNHYMPINAFWGYNDKSYASYAIVRLLMQIYCVKNEDVQVLKYIVDNINVLNSYTETWNVKLNSNVNINDINSTIILKHDNNKLSLSELTSIVNNKIDISNIVYGFKDNKKNLIDNVDKVLIPNVISHKFNINMNDLYNIYESNKNTAIPAMCYVSVYGKTIITKIHNKNNFYVFQNGDLKKLDKTTSSAIYNITSNGTITLNKINNATVYSLKIPDGIEPRKNIDLCNMMICNNGELYFDEEALLLNTFDMKYKTKEGATIKGNCKHKFLIGNER